MGSPFSKKRIKALVDEVVEREVERHFVAEIRKRMDIHGPITSADVSREIIAYVDSAFRVVRKRRMAKR